MRLGLATACAIAVVLGGTAYVAVRQRSQANAVAEAETKAKAAEANARAEAEKKAEIEAETRAKAKARATERRETEARAFVPESAAAKDDSIDELAVEGDLPVYVVQPRPGTGRPRTIFLTGSCTHPSTYVRELRQAAAAHGGIVALQGDLPCKGGPTLRRWSPDAAATSARIEAALRAAGITETKGITVIGYSQGAERAEWLASRFPAKYTRFVLMAGPVVPSPSRLSGAESVVTLAGYGDVRENMADGAKRLRRAAIPATYMELPGSSQHGELSSEADEVVGRALDWLDENASLTPRPNRRVRARQAPRRSQP